MKKKKKIWLIVLILAVVVIAAVCIIKASRSANKELVIRTHAVEEYTVENTVTATGTIEPVETVEVGTQVSGKVEKIYVDFNDVVKKGDLLAELDKLTLNQSVSRAKASLTSAESQLNYAQVTYERTKQLYEANAATLAAYQEAQNTYTQAQMSKKNAQASYDQALVDLAYAEIYSPIDGIVLDRAVEVGQTVDAYLNDNFEGLVSQIRMKPTTTSNVVTYTVIIDAPNPDLKLFPGMTASVTIVTEEQTGLAVPAEAFNFTPDETVLKALRKSHDKPVEGQGPQGPMPQGERPQMDGQMPSASPSMVWVKKGDDMMPRPVKTGLSDGAYKIIEQGLQAGDSVVLSAQYVVKQKDKKKGENPFMPGPPGKNKNNSDSKGNKAPSGPPM